jgi:hypothetical protein
MVDGDILSQVPAADVAPVTTGKKLGFCRGRPRCSVDLCEIAGTRVRPMHAKRPGATPAASCAPRRAANPGRDVPSLLDVRQDAVELVEAVVTHDQLALAAGRMLDGHFGAKLVGELLLETLDVRVTAILALCG